MPNNIKRSFRPFLVLTIFSFLLATWAEAKIPDDPPKGIRTVVIDAGHGGRDPGAVGKKAKEKDLALAISLKVGKYIEENIPEVKVIYTRKKDEYIELWKRADIANKADADLFISIHVNALHKPEVQGTLTLVLGQHRAEENLDVAMRENSVILLEEDYEITYEGFDPKSTESYIMFSLMQKTYFKQSIEFGDFVQDQFRERANRRDLGVREQGILVLARTTMPGVLVETGFISNAEEEKYLMSKYGQEIIASAIYRGFKEYKEEIDRRSNLSVVVSDSPPKAETEAQQAEAKTQPDPASSSWQETVRASVSGTAPVLFRIQVASSKNNIDPQPSLFKGYKDVKVIQDGRWYKYLVGEESSYHDALEMCNEVKKDYPDAFVVASKNQKIIPLKTALEEINR